MADSTAQKAFELFKEELSSEELSVRVNTIRRLPLVIHLASTVTAVKDQLLQYLDKLIDDSDDDEVVFGLAEGLTVLSNYFPASRLLGLYEKMLASEETIVREKTVESFLKMARRLDRSEIAGTIVPFIQKLTGNQAFGTKMSVLGIMTEMFPLASGDEKRMFLEKLGALFAEESLILRRNLAGRLGRICQHLPKEVLTLEINTHFKNLSNDDSDSVRIITIESLIELARVFNDEENKAHVIPLIIQMTGDKSWRVRHHLAKSFASLAEAVGKDIADNSLISIFSTLLRDPENEVRVAAVQSLKRFVLCLNIDKIPQIFAYLQSMAKDSIALVRTGACEVLQVILTFDLDQMGKDLSRTKVLPIVVELCGDKDTEVKIETMKVLPLWTRWSGPFVLEQISAGGLPIATDSPNWRIRLAVLESFVGMALELKSAKLFDKHIKKIVANAIHDRVFQIRKAIIKNLPKLASSFLDDASLTEIFFKEYSRVVGDMSNFYIYRVSALYGLEAVINVIQNKDKLKEQYVKLLAKAAEDPNVNVRYVAHKVALNGARQKPFSELTELVKKLAVKAKESEKDSEIKFVLEEFQK